MYTRCCEDASQHSEVNNADRRAQDMHTHTHTHTHTGQPDVDFNEERNERLAMTSAGLYANHLHLAIGPTEITSPALHHTPDTLADSDGNSLKALKSERHRRTIVLAMVSTRHKVAQLHGFPRS